MWRRSRRRSRSPRTSRCDGRALRAAAPLRARAARATGEWRWRQGRSRRHVARGRTAAAGAAPVARRAASRAARPGGPARLRSSSSRSLPSPRWSRAIWFGGDVIWFVFVSVRHSLLISLPAPTRTHGTSAVQLSHLILFRLFTKSSQTKVWQFAGCHNFGPRSWRRKQP